MIDILEIESYKVEIQKTGDKFIGIVKELGIIVENSDMKALKRAIKREIAGKILEMILEGNKTTAKLELRRKNKKEIEAKIKQKRKPAN